MIMPLGRTSTVTFGNQRSDFELHGDAEHRLLETKPYAKNSICKARLFITEKRKPPAQSLKERTRTRKHPSRWLTDTREHNISEEKSGIFGHTKTVQM